MTISAEIFKIAFWKHCLGLILSDKGQSEAILAPDWEGSIIMFDDQVSS